jgi:hypothetical protein
LERRGGVAFDGLLARAVDGERLARIGGPDSSGFIAQTQTAKLRVLSTAVAEATEAACWYDDQSIGLGELFLSEYAAALSATGVAFSKHALRRRGRLRKRFGGIITPKNDPRPLFPPSLFPRTLSQVGRAGDSAAIGSDP